MKKMNQWSSTLLGLATAFALVACGGGGGGGSAVTPTPAPTPTPPVVTPAPPVVTPVPEVGAPVFLGDIAIDGRNWINFRRSQAGMPVMTANAAVSVAAKAHSTYQKNNNIVSHDEVAGLAGFSGIHLLERLTAAGYTFANNNSYAYGEVIAATSSTSGAYMAEELITAIFHRFVMFEPMFKEVGTGAATTAGGYSYFTSDFTANNGYGPGIGRGVIVTWPFNGQVNVTPNFFSNTEEPDPIPNADEVGYPVSVHGDLTSALTVQSFTIRQRGGADLAVQMIKHFSDRAETIITAAAIVPLAVLKPATVYDVSFIGSADGTALTKTWSFTTK
jgi:uncharacterized protein YkwD